MDRPIRPPVDAARLTELLEWLEQPWVRNIDPITVQDLRAVCVELETRRRHAEREPRPEPIGPRHDMGT